MNAAIETERLTHRFGRSEVVSDVSFSVPEGSIYAFLGPNGAGKSTTIQVLMNLLRPTAGRATVLGVPSTRLGPRDRQRIGYVSATQELPEWMTTEQLLAYCRPLYPSWDDDLAAELLRRFDLPAKQRIRSLSRGMKMKTAVMAALAYRPRLLVLDEPFSGLDPVVRDEIIKGMLEMAGRGEWSILIASHDLSEVENLADYVGFIRNGRMLVSEPLEALQRRFREVEVTLPGEAPTLDPWPGQWLVPTTTGRVVRFIDSQYSEDETQRRIRQSFPEEARYSTSTVSLREIFTALARTELRPGGLA